MGLTKRQKLAWITTGIAATFLIGLFSPSITGSIIGVDKGKEVNRTELVLKLNRSISKINETITELFKCKSKLLEYNLTLKEKEDLLSKKSRILSNKTEKLKTKEEELKECRNNLKDYKKFLNTSYKIAKELGSQGICNDISRDPTSIQACFEKIRDSEEYWKVIVKFKETSDLLK